MGSIGPVQSVAVSEAGYRTQVKGLRRELLKAQVALRSADFPVIVVFGGVDGGGKGETANLLNAWMDPRHIVTRAFGRPSDEESERPEYWRFWRALPARGEMGLFLRAWYSMPLLQRAFGRTDASVFDAQLDRIVAFERTLTDGGALVVKFWMHLGKEDQAKRFRALEADPNESWRVTPLDWKHWEMYDAFMEASERLIERTNQPASLWTVLDGADPLSRTLVVGRSLLDHLQSSLAARSPSSGLGDGEPGPTAQEAPSGSGRTARAASPGHATRPLERIDLTQSLSGAEYEEARSVWQGRLHRLARQAATGGRSTILVFEGWDASGKGGTIRRMAAAETPT